MEQIHYEVQIQSEVGAWVKAPRENVHEDISAAMEDMRQRGITYARLRYRVVKVTTKTETETEVIDPLLRVSTQHGVEYTSVVNIKTPSGVILIHIKDGDTTIDYPRAAGLFFQTRDE